MTSTASRNYCSIARRYEEEVLSGSIPACEFVKDAVRRNRQDLETYKVSGSFVFNAAEGAGYAGSSNCHLPRVSGFTPLPEVPHFIIST